MKNIEEFPGEKVRRMADQQKKDKTERVTGIWVKERERRQKR